MSRPEGQSLGDGYRQRFLSLVQQSSHEVSQPAEEHGAHNDVIPDGSNRPETLVGNEDDDSSSSLDNLKRTLALAALSLQDDSDDPSSTESYRRRLGGYLNPHYSDQGFDADDLELYRGRFKNLTSIALSAEDEGDAPNDTSATQSSFHIEETSESRVISPVSSNVEGQDGPSQLTTLDRQEMSSTLPAPCFINIVLTK